MHTDACIHVMSSPCVLECEVSRIKLVAGHKPDLDKMNVAPSNRPHDTALARFHMMRERTNAAMKLRLLHARERCTEKIGVLVCDAFRV